MHQVFDIERLLHLATVNHTRYQEALPFPHIVIDDFANPAALDDVLAVFPKAQEMDFYQYNNPLEKKLAFDQIHQLPESIAHVLYAINSPIFLNFLEQLTGIEGLIPDPYLRGGGIHQIEKGGKLDIHIDFNRYTKLNLYRRLNVLLYLNKDWKEEYGGHFELWRGHKENGKHVLDECNQRILPIFNRLAIFTTSEHSYHGHPDPLTCPDNRTRKSIAAYFYTTQSPAHVHNEPAHSTTFIKRPQDPDDPTLDTLRDKRNNGRLQTNILSDFTA